MATAPADLLGRLGIVIVTYRSAPHILGLLNSLPHDRLPVIVVVENASGDSTPELVRGAQMPKVELLELPRNVGFGGGCNAGFERVGDRAEYVLFLNPDALIDAMSLMLLVEYLAAHPSCGAVAPRLYRAGRPLASAGRLATTVSELRFVLPRPLGRLIPDRRFPPEYDTTGPVGVVEGACLLVRGPAFAACGGFDESYFLFFEEHDLAQRFGRRGWSMDLCAAAGAEHLVGESRRELHSSGRAFYFGSTARYLGRWRGRRAAGIYCFVATCWWRLQHRRGVLTTEAVTAFRSAVREAREQHRPHRGGADRDHGPSAADVPCGDANAQQGVPEPRQPSAHTEGPESPGAG